MMTYIITMYKEHMHGSEPAGSKAPPDGSETFPAASKALPDGS